MGTSDCWCVLDAVPGAKLALASGRVNVLKVNASELRTLSEKHASALLQECAERLQQLYNVEWIAVTNGADDAKLFSVDGSWSYALPALGAVNPIGAGDTCTALLLEALVEGVDVPSAFQSALAAAMAHCLPDLPEAELAARRTHLQRLIRVSRNGGNSTSV